MTVGELLKLIALLKKEGDITNKTMILVSGDEEGNSFGNLYSMTVNGSGYQTQEKVTVNHDMPEDISDEIMNKALVFWPLT